MIGEKYILDCPRCGRVTGFAPGLFADDATALGSPEDFIEEQVFETRTGPKVRIRCPLCGCWMSPDRAIPA